MTARGISLSLALFFLNVAWKEAAPMIEQFAFSVESGNRISRFAVPRLPSSSTSSSALIVTPSRFSSLWLFCTSIFQVLSAFGSKEPMFSSVALKYPTKTGMAVGPRHA